MRTAFIEKLFELAVADPRIMLVVGDLGFGVVTPFMEKLPRQFVNVGVAEQNMTGVAAGLALSGKIVFTYSIANFPTLRCLEQIRNDICYHGADVKIVAVGGGMGYGSLGMSHHATEDIAIMQALPRMTVLAPGDPKEAARATQAVVTHGGPCYLRLGRAGEPVVHESAEIEFTLGKAIVVRDGKDLTLVSTGGMLATAVEVAGRLKDRGLETRVISMHTVKPLDKDAVLKAASETGAVFTLEEHSIVGGLGSSVAALLLEAGGARVAFKRIGLPDEFLSECGDQDYLRSICGLAPEQLVATIEAEMAKIKC